MHARPMTKRDFDQIVQVIDDWWGGLTRNLAQPVFFYELPDMNRVVDLDGRLAGFLFGFLTPTDPPVAYVHLVGVNPDFRRKGVGRFLYTWFEGEARSRGCDAVKATTTLGNEGQLLFHQALGYDAHEIADYAGPGRARIVFTKKLR